MAVDQYTVSLLHFNEGLKDETGKVWTAFGGASTDGGTSLNLSTSSQGLTTPIHTDFALGDVDFTIDCWVFKTTQWSPDYEYLAAHATQYGVCSWMIYFTNGKLSFATGKDKWDWPFMLTGSKVLELNKWNHIAISRSGSNLYLLVNGVVDASVSNFSNFSTAALNMGLGANLYSPGCLGYIDEFRISKGIARWTDNFTPPNNPGGTPGNPTIVAPSNLVAAPADAKVNLSWNEVTGATGYNVKRATAAGGPYTTIASNVIGTGYVDSAVTNGTTYYYVVTAITANDESANSNEASATPTASGGNPGTGDQAQLRVTMIDSSEREYKLPKVDIDGFIGWLDSHSSGDTLSYPLNTAFGSKEHLLFDKIISFEVIPVA